MFVIFQDYAEFKEVKELMIRAENKKLTDDKKLQHMMKWYKTHKRTPNFGTWHELSSETEWKWGEAKIWDAAEKKIKEVWNALLRTQPDVYGLIKGPDKEKTSTSPDKGAQTQAKKAKKGRGQSNVNYSDEQKSAAYQQLAIDYSQNIRNKKLLKFLNLYRFKHNKFKIEDDSDEEMEFDADDETKYEHGPDADEYQSQGEDVAAEDDEVDAEDEDVDAGDDEEEDVALSKGIAQRTTARRPVTKQSPIKTPSPVKTPRVSSKSSKPLLASTTTSHRSTTASRNLTMAASGKPVLLSGKPTKSSGKPAKTSGKSTIVADNDDADFVMDTRVPSIGSRKRRQSSPTVDVLATLKRKKGVASSSTAIASRSPPLTAAASRSSRSPPLTAAASRSSRSPPLTATASRSPPSAATASRSPPSLATNRTSSSSASLSPSTGGIGLELLESMTKLLKESEKNALHLSRLDQHVSALVPSQPHPSALPMTDVQEASALPMTDVQEASTRVVAVNQPVPYKAGEILAPTTAHIDIEWSRHSKFYNWWKQMHKIQCAQWTAHVNMLINRNRVMRLTASDHPSVFYDLDRLACMGGLSQSLMLASDADKDTLDDVQYPLATITCSPGKPGLMTATATQNIQQGTFILPYRGMLLTQEEAGLMDENLGYNLGVFCKSDVMTLYHVKPPAPPEEPAPAEQKKSSTCKQKSNKGGKKSRLAETINLEDDDLTPLTPEQNEADMLVLYGHPRSLACQPLHYEGVDGPDDDEGRPTDLVAANCKLAPHPQWPNPQAFDDSEVIEQANGIRNAALLNPFIMGIVALRDIAAGDELTVDYDAGGSNGVQHNHYCELCGKQCKSQNLEYVCNQRISVKLQMSDSSANNVRTSECKRRICRLCRIRDPRTGCLHHVQESTCMYCASIKEGEIL